MQKSLLIIAGFTLHAVAYPKSSNDCSRNLFSNVIVSFLGSTQLPIQCVPGALFPGVKQQGREADHSPPASAEVKKMWIYTPSWRSA
jgi:hypothetical protein